MVSVAAAGVTSLALSSDGSVWQWGLTACCANPRYVLMPQRLEALTDVVAIAAGWFENLALKRDGTVWQWGIDPPQPEPAQVTNLGGVAAIAIGGGCCWAYDHAVVAQVDGTVSSWGTDFPAISIVPSDLGGVVATGAGMYDSVALKSDGTLRNWGPGARYDLSGVSHVVAIAVGEDHTLALKDNGEVWGAGSCVWSNCSTNLIYSAMYGNPARIEGLTDAVALATSDSHGLALKRDGTVWEWGTPMGEGTTLQLTPVQVTGLPPVLFGGFRREPL